MVFKTLYLCVSVLIVVLGALVSITIGFLDGHETFVDGATKASIGIAVMLAGFLNIALVRSDGDSVVRLTCVLGNILLASIFGLGGYLNAQSPLPFVWMSLLFGAAVFSILFKPKHRLD